jgi:hypothetical protein
LNTCTRVIFLSVCCCNCDQKPTQCNYFVHLRTYAWLPWLQQLLICGIIFCFSYY